MLGVFGLVFYCSPKQHLGGRDGHGAGWFGNQEEVSSMDMDHLGCLGDGELMSAAGVPH